MTGLLSLRIVLDDDGDLEAEKELLPFAKNQLNILRTAMGFQNLEQDMRIVNMVGGGKIIVKSSFGQEVIYIYWPPAEEKAPEDLTGLIVIGYDTQIRGEYYGYVYDVFIVWDITKKDYATGVFWTSSSGVKTTIKKTDYPFVSPEPGWDGLAQWEVKGGKRKTDKNLLPMWGNDSTFLYNDLLPDYLAVGSQGFELADTHEDYKCLVTSVSPTGKLFGGYYLSDIYFAKDIYAGDSTKIGTRSYNVITEDVVCPSVHTRLGTATICGTTFPDDLYFNITDTDGIFTGLRVPGESFAGAFDSDSIAGFSTDAFHNAITLYAWGWYCNILAFSWVKREYGTTIAYLYGKYKYVKDIVFIGGPLGSYVFDEDGPSYDRTGISREDAVLTFEPTFAPDNAGPMLRITNETPAMLIGTQRQEGNAIKTVVNYSYNYHTYIGDIAWEYILTFDANTGNVGCTGDCASYCFCDVSFRTDNFCVQIYVDKNSEKNVLAQAYRKKGGKKEYPTTQRTSELEVAVKKLALKIIEVNDAKFGGSSIYNRYRLRCFNTVFI